MPGTTTRALRNSVFQGLTQVVTWALSWVLLIILPRFLGDAGFGKLFLGLSYSMVLGALMNMGVNNYLIKQVAILNPDAASPAEKSSNDAALRELLGNVFALKIMLSVAAYALLACLVFIFPYDPLTRQVILIICAASCISNLGMTAGGVFHGLESMLQPNLALIVEKTVATAGCTVLLLLGYELIPICFVYVAAAAANSAVSLYLLARRVRFKLIWDKNYLKQLLIGGVPFLVWIVFGEIYVRVDVLMLSFLTRDSVVGWFGAAFRIYATLLFVPHMLNTVVFPPLARLGADTTNNVSFSQAACRVMNLLLSVAFPISAGVFTVAAPLVLLLYGEGPFTNSIVSLRIFSGCILLVCVDVLLGSVLIARGKQKQWSYMAVIAAVFNPLMNLWMIPLSQELWGNGGIGAATATLLTEGLMMFGALVLLPAGILSSQNLVTAAKAAACALFMVFVLRLWGIDNVPVIAVTGTLIYGILALLVRLLPPSDIHHILHAVGLQNRGLKIQRLLGIKN